ncbi:flagellar hook-associated protein 2 [Geobacillus stearothermophilus]|uniref:flagellar hook-associated protein 2 n=1 Tax=Geobacillus stearothermophilus TaxID=1422 RepID=UPI003D20F377
MANTLRISGLASGMDIDKIVSDLMKAERMPLDKLKQKKQLLEWQRDDYREMNKLLSELDTSIFDGIYRQATFTKQTVISSNEAAVSVRNISSTSQLTSTIKVTQLAENAYMYGAVAVGNANFDPSQTLLSQDSNITKNNGYTLSSGTKEIRIKAIKSDGTMPTEWTTIQFDPSVDSLNSLINKINSSQAGVVAFYDSRTGRVSLTAKNTGDASEGAEIVIDGTADRFLIDVLKLPQDSDIAAATQDPSNNTIMLGRKGKNAQFTINGLPTERPTNVFQINGYEYTLKQTTASEVTVTASTDVDAIFNSIKSFVDKYNETIAKINAELKEERYRDYPPLTDEQKEAMTEKQIELWEEKARSGMLRGDSILSSALSQMRMNVYTKVEGANIPSGFSQLAQIGITTSSNYLDGGKLIIDETKLREKIKENPDAVYQLFNQDGATDAEKGIARRLRDTIKATIGKIEQKAGKTIWTNQQFAIGRDLIEINDQIDRFEDRLKQIEDRYYRQFTAMEEAIQRANQQSMYLMNAFGGGMQG